ncbi:hypothetical protein HBH70_068420 [Parastagonospora nodorum]|nr:hypothetical protein HBH51_121780 [Parastagonospora nodorum]KAH3988616.1 hypothetical protein HBH52_030280 [Parastagonospora nodorum]KAH4053782.1 hypothetical protein HBH49_088440 [Parastagonospora nodorum]KAH4067092.1 hypothetical protein HBH50_135410 [Parastagonospora nodorum]KAH4085253.1 hypothetical protein HBH48_158550 [Parastagonospora nodorum]
MPGKCGHRNSCTRGRTCIEQCFNGHDCSRIIRDCVNCRTPIKTKCRDRLLLALNCCRIVGVAQESFPLGYTADLGAKWFASPSASDRVVVDWRIVEKAQRSGVSPDLVRHCK